MIHEPYEGDDREPEVLVMPVTEWRVAQLDDKGTTALQMKDEHGIACAYAFKREELFALYSVISDLVNRLSSVPTTTSP